MGSARSPVATAAFAVTLLLAAPLAAQDESGRVWPPRRDYLIPAGASSGLPLVKANDNTAPAGTVREGVREVSLEIMRADWRVETARGPGLRVAAVAEKGGPPVIPAPLIRAEEGTLLRVRVRNALEDDSVQVFGLHARPSQSDSSFDLAPGEQKTVEFTAGAPGTYLYRIEEGRVPDPGPDGFPFLEREQLAGAFVVDPEGGSPGDRILVINIYGQSVVDEDSERGYVEGLAINGRSWPYTDLVRLEVGEKQRWRVVNASQRFHPMHLHGFFYDVLARGTMTGDTTYSPASRRLVVTEPMQPFTTMLMEWTPTREGRWLFHCHLSFHVWPELRLPGAVEADPEHAHSHMAGLVVGIDVASGPTDLVSEGEPLSLDLFAREYGQEDGFRYGFARDSAHRPDSLTEAPGPLLVFNQYQAADVTVHNAMSVPTGVHWHGLELDSWADGVPTWSASAGRVSPVIEPGASFTYRLHLMRPGSFIYHSHLNDVDQLSGGLYGPLIVLRPGEDWDSRTDHVKLWGWNSVEPSGPDGYDLNGVREQPDAEAVVGETHRFRIMHIAPAGRISAWMTKDGQVVPITLFAKDGADLPPHQRVPVDRLTPLGVGEVADFTWTPSEPGVYELRIGEPLVSFPQRWVVTAGGEEARQQR